MSARKRPSCRSPLDSREPLLKPIEIAYKLSLDRSTVYRALESGELRGFKIGTGPKAQWRVRIEDMEAWAGVAKS